MQLLELREEIVRSCKDLCASNLMCFLGAGGNVSVRDPISGLIAMTPSQLRYDTMRAGDVVIVDLSGKVIEAESDRIPTSELATHTMIYRERTDINAIVHTHAPYATAVAAILDGIPALSYELLYFVGRSVPVIPFCMPGTIEMARSVTAGLKDTQALIIRNHGTFAVGDALGETVVRAVAVEDAAKMYSIACAIGEPRLLPEDVRKPALSVLNTTEN